MRSGIESGMRIANADSAASATAGGGRALPGGGAGSGGALWSDAESEAAVGNNTGLALKCAGSTGLVCKY